MHEVRVGKSHKRPVNSQSTRIKRFLNSLLNQKQWLHYRTLAGAIRTRQDRNISENHTNRAVR